MYNVGTFLSFITRCQQRWTIHCRSYRNLALNTAHRKTYRPAILN